MKLLKNNSPSGDVSIEDLKVPLFRLLWALVGVIAVWLNVELPETIGENTVLNLALSGAAMYAANILFRVIKDNSGSQEVK